MIITWFTDPSKGTFKPGDGTFSSYYQYDTSTRSFVRIRLELGRTSGSGKTRSMYSEERYVGFATDSDFRTSKKDRWSVDEEGQLCYEKAPLKSTPMDGYRTYDVNARVITEKTDVHKGSPVTQEAHLPEGIEVKHLSLLANDAIIQQKGVEFTKSTASPEDVSEALKQRVCQILDKQPFDTIQDGDILNKLKSQVREIKATAVADTKAALEGSMKQVDDLVDAIKFQMEKEGMVPDEEFNKAFEELGENLKQAKGSIATGTDVKQSIRQLSDASAKLSSKVELLEQKYASALESKVETSRSAVETAIKESGNWERIESEYSKSESADSIKEYEESIGYDAEETIER